MNQIKVFLSGYYRDIVFIFDKMGLQFSKVKDFRYHINRFRFDKTKQLEFIIDFSSFLKSSGPLFACESIIGGVEASKDSPLKKYVAQSIIEALNEGKDVSDGMKRWFDKDAVQIYRAGELAGNIEEVLMIYSKQFEQISAFKKSLFSGLKMPAIMLLAGISGLCAMARNNWMDFPKFKDVSTWLPPAQFSYELSFTINDNITVVSVWILILYKIYMWLIENNTSSTRMMFDSVFPLSLFKGFQALRFIKILTVLKTARCGDFMAVRIIHENSSKYIRYFTSIMQEKLNTGVADIGEVIDVNLLPPRLISRVYAVAKASGDEAKIQALQTASDYAENEIAMTLARSKAILTIVGWVVGGTAIGTLMIGFLTTTLSISQR
jgi:type II secretory pathway component PulF